LQYKHIPIYTKRKINHHLTVFCSKENQHLYLARINRTRKPDKTSSSVLHVIRRKGCLTCHWLWRKNIQLKARANTIFPLICSEDTPSV
jgi:hypothetical protein